MNNSERLDSQISEHSFRDKKLSKMPSSLFKSFTQSKKGGVKEEFFIKSQECGFNTVLYMLVNFQKVEEDSKKKGFSILGKSKPICEMDSYTDLSILRPELIYFFSVISVRDLHDFYIDFYASFDANKNFVIDKKELFNMFQIVLNLLGKRKFKVFSDLALVDQDAFEGELTYKVIEDIADNFTSPDDSNKVDYLLLFPYILSFYLEYTYQEIKNKQKRLDIMKGTEFIKGKEVEIKNITSLISILREMGIDYLQEKNSYKLSYRDVENILLKFKNIQKWMTFDVIQQILQQLSKIMSVDLKTQEEAKKLKVEKIINFMALKLCIHQQCLKIKQTQKNNGQSVFLEVLVMWNAAQFGQYAEKKFLNPKFEKYLKTQYEEQESFNRAELQKCLERFFKKKYQLMPKQQIYDIIQCHKLFHAKNIVKNYKIEKDDLLQSLHTMICTEGYNKLRQYIKIKFDGISKKSNTPINYQNYGKNLEQESNQGGQSSQRQLIEQQYQSQQYETQKKEQKKEAKKVMDENNSSESEDEEKFKEGARGKFKKAVRAVQSGNAFQQEGGGSKDILKACLIMDSFLKRQTQRIKNYQKASKSLNNSFLKQQQDPKAETQQNDFQEPTILEQAAEQNKRKRKNESKLANKEWEMPKEEKPKEEKSMDVEANINKQLQKIEQAGEVKGKKMIDRQRVADELSLVLGKSSNDFGPGDFKKALRVQTATSAVQQPMKPFIKQTEAQDNLVIIDEGALEHMIKTNAKQQKARKSTRDDCKCKIF